MITLCDEGTPGGPGWLWGGVGAWAEPLMNSWDGEGGRKEGELFLVGCPQIVLHPSLMST